MNGKPAEDFQLHIYCNTRNRRIIRRFPGAFKLTALCNISGNNLHFNIIMQDKDEQLLKKAYIGLAALCYQRDIRSYTDFSDVK